MIEVVNRQRGPIQLVIRSKKGPRAFTTLSVPGVGAGQNTIYLQDEQWTENLDRLQKETKFISMKQVSSKPIKGE